MLSLTKRTDYALIALGYLAENPNKVAPAREIASAFQMPLALVMNILKALHHGNMLASTRGTKGGYQLTADLSKISLHDLIELLEGPVHLAECTLLPDPCPETGSCKIRENCPIKGPIQALHHKLISFLREVKLADLVVPSRRIDVPHALVGIGGHR